MALNNMMMGMGRIGYGGYDSIPIVSSLLQAAELNKKKRIQEFEQLSQEEQEQIIIERQEAEKREAEDREIRRVQYFVNRGKCPNCGSKLYRGKKDKHNDYKRAWYCTNEECRMTFTI